MRISLLISGLCVLILFSCGENSSSEQKHDSVADTVNTNDTAAQLDTVPAAIIASQLGGDTITTADMSQVFYPFSNDLLTRTGKKLSAKEVKERFYPLDTACDAEVVYKIQRFMLIDSLKKRGEFPDSDMGQMIFGEAMLLDTIKRSPSGTWVLWSLRYKSEDACPYSEGTFFVLSTYDAAGKLVSSQCMARDEGGADAPLFWSTKQTCNIFTDGSFRGLYCDTVGDYNDDGSATYSSIIRKTYTGTISSAGKITRTTKEIERNE